MTNIFEKSQQGLFSNPNVLINTCFTVNQRDSATYNSNGFGFDRLWLNTGGAGVLSRTENNYTSNPFKAPYYATANVTTGQNAGGLGFSCEDSRRFRGNPTMTLSFWYRLSGRDISIDEAHAYGGSSGWQDKRVIDTLPQADVWTKFDVTFDVSTWSQSYSSDDVFFIGVRQTDTATTPFTLDIADVKLEFGSVATPWVMEDPQHNLARCQRFYYYRPNNMGVSARADSSQASANEVYMGFTFPVQMRSKPSLTYTSSNWSITNINQHLSVYGFTFYGQCTGTSGATAGQIRANAELL